METIGRVPLRAAVVLLEGPVTVPQALKGTLQPSKAPSKEAPLKGTLKGSL